MAGMDLTRKGEVSPEPWPGLSLERRHIFTALHQVQKLQRSSTIDLDDALLGLNRTSVVSVSGAQYAGVTLIEADGDIRTLGPPASIPACWTMCSATPTKVLLYRRPGTSTLFISKIWPTRIGGPRTARPH